MTRLASHCHHCTAARTAALISMLVAMTAPVPADELAVARYSTVRAVPTAVQRDALANTEAQRRLADGEQTSHPRGVTVPGTHPPKAAAAAAKACDE